MPYGHICVAMFPVKGQEKEHFSTEKFLLQLLLYEKKCKKAYLSYS